jgi:hypothetical protein
MKWGKRAIRTIKALASDESNVAWFAVFLIAGIQVFAGKGRWLEVASFVEIALAATVALAVVPAVWRAIFPKDRRRTWMLGPLILGAVGFALVWWFGGRTRAAVFLLGAAPMHAIVLASIDRLPKRGRRRAWMFASGIGFLGALQYLWLLHFYDEIAFRWLLKHRPFDAPPGREPWPVLGPPEVLLIIVFVGVLAWLGSPTSTCTHHRMRDKHGRSRPVPYVISIVACAVGIPTLRAQIPPGQWALPLEDAVTVALTLLVAGLTRLICYDVGDIPRIEDVRPNVAIESERRKRLAIVRRREAAWYRDYRKASGISCDDHGPNIGLALSGGGIRSATICLGITRALARRSKVGDTQWLSRAECVSSVSGGGWLAGALTVRAADPERPEKLPPLAFLLDARPFFARLTSSLRRAGDYLAPGGLRFSKDTVGPILAVVWGALVNLIPIAALSLSVLVTLSGAPRDKHVLFELLNKARELWLLDHLFVGQESAFGRYLYGINVIPLLFALATLFLVGVLFVMVLGYFVDDGLTGGREIIVAGYAGMTAAVLGVATVILHGQQSATWLIFGLVALAALAVVLPRLSRAQIGAVVGLVFAGSGITANVGSVRRFVEGITPAWRGVFERALLAPGCWVANAENGSGRSVDAQILVAGGGLVLFFLFGILIARNNAGMHAHWRRQIRRGYLALEPLKRTPTFREWRASVRTALRGIRPVSREPADQPFFELAPRLRRSAPLHIVNCAVNLPGSDDSVIGGRRTARFEMSPLFIGGPATGWTAAKNYPEMTLARAIAISAAAVNSQGGRSIPAAARGIISLLNLGLGVWLVHPYLANRKERGQRDRRDRLWPHFWTYLLGLELMGANDEGDPLVFVSDGGHHDNLGVTALLDRCCRTIVCVDATGDPHYEFGDLAQVARLASVGSLDIDGEGGFVLEGIDIGAMRPDDPHGTFEERCSPLPVMIGSFRKEGEDPITFIYVKATLVKDVPFTVRQFAERNRHFPQQTTADQFFDEAQFEAYADLGEHLGAKVVQALETVQRRACT